MNPIDQYKVAIYAERPSHQTQPDMLFMDDTPVPDSHVLEARVSEPSVHPSIVTGIEQAYEFYGQD